MWKKTLSSGGTILRQFNPDEYRWAEVSDRPQHTADTVSVYRYGSRWKVVYFKVGRCQRSPPQPSPEGEALGAIISPPSERFSQSVSRSKARVFELAACNPFEYFCTFTLDEAKRDRYDLVSFRRDFAMMVRNINRRDGEKIKYLCVPERHQDGAWHLHGLLMGFHDGDLVANEYGYLEWKAYSSRFGFFNCSPIRDHDKTASYIVKYVSKGFTVDNYDSNAHMFFASQGLASRENILHNRRVSDINGTVSCWDFENDYVKVRWLDEPPQFDVL